MITTYDAEGFRACIQSLIGDQTQRAFAKSHGMTPEQLNRLLKHPCKHKPSVKTVERLAAGDDAVYRQLLGYIDVPPRETVYVYVQPAASAAGEFINAHDYQIQASRTINPRLSRDSVTQHALYGMAAEVGELQALYQKAYQGHDFDPEHAKREIGDIIWMVAEYCTAQGWDLGEVMQANVDKLWTRYPDGFDPEHSLHNIDNQSSSSDSI